MTTGIPGRRAQLRRHLDRDLLCVADHHLRDSVAVLHYMRLTVRERVHRDEHLSPVVAVYGPAGDEHSPRGEARAPPALHTQSRCELHREPGGDSDRFGPDLHWPL